MSKVIPFPKPTVPPIRAVHPVDEALSLLRRAELKAGVEASEAVADELEKLRAVVEEMLANEFHGGLL